LRKRKGKVMQTEETFQPDPEKRSLTDRILTLCASGHFGVREAIAAAAKQLGKSQAKVTDSAAKPAESRVSSVSGSKGGSLAGKGT